MTNLDIQILGLWDRGLDTVDITRFINISKLYGEWHEANVHRLLIRAKQERRIVTGVKHESCVSDHACTSNQIPTSTQV